MIEIAERITPTLSQAHVTSNVTSEETILLPVPSAAPDSVEGLATAGAEPEVSTHKLYVTF